MDMQEWVSGDRGGTANWKTLATDTVIYHEVFRQTPLAFSELKNQAEDANTFLASLSVCLCVLP